MKNIAKLSLAAFAATVMMTGAASANDWPMKGPAGGPAASCSQTTPTLAVYGNGQGLGQREVRIMPPNPYSYRPYVKMLK